MTNLIQKVTPLTRGLIWTCQKDLHAEASSYKDIDYLVNGLLTASILNHPEQNSRVIISENFGQNFYVLIGHQISESEFQSYFSLIKNQLAGDNHLLLVDENKSFSHIQKLAPQEVRSKILVTEA